MRGWIATVLSALVAAALPSPAAAQNGCAPIARTPRLGMQIVQDGAPAALCLSDDGRTIIATLRRAPFEVRVPIAAWSGEAPGAPLEIAVSDRPGFADLVRFGENEGATFYFGMYRAMARYPQDTELLLTSEDETDADITSWDYGYNSFDVADLRVDGDARALLISRIERRYFRDDSLMHGDKPVTVVVYLNQLLDEPALVPTEYGMQDVIAAGEIEVFQLSFAD